MTVHSRKRLHGDTEMAELAATQCMKAHRRGDLFSLEHPRNSIAKSLQSW